VSFSFSVAISTSKALSSGTNVSAVYILSEHHLSHLHLPFKDKAQTALFKDPVRTAL